MKLNAVAMSRVLANIAKHHSDNNGTDDGMPFLHMFLIATAFTCIVWFRKLPIKDYKKYTQRL